MTSQQQNTANRPDSSAGRRTTSFGSFIKRTKSTDLLSSNRRASGDRLRDQQTRQRSPSIPVQPPAIPTLAHQPSIPTFGGEDYVPTTPKMSKANGLKGAPPVPAVPAGYAATDAYARTESMTHRSRYSYANSMTSALNSPRRVRRRKDPTPYNILVVGAKNCGKTSFVEFLKTSLKLPVQKQVRGSDETPSPVKSYPGFDHHYQEIEIDHERIGLTIWDSPGLDKGIVDLQLKELTTFVESKFEETFAEEMKVMRTPGFRDTEIHVIFMLLDPGRLDLNLAASQQSNGGATGRIGKTSKIIGALDEDFDLQVLKGFQGKSTIVPIISKADTVTIRHMAHLKKMVHQGFRDSGLDPLEALNIAEPSESEGSEDEDVAEVGVGEVDSDGNASDTPHDSTGKPSGIITNKRTSTLIRHASHKREASGVSISSQMMDYGYVPMSILSPDPDTYQLDVTPSTTNAAVTVPVGRHFPWGYADPYNADHCDFVKLKDAVFSEWRNEIREANREMFYERWRTERLNRREAARAEHERQKTQLGTSGQRKSSGVPIHLKSNMGNMF